jgi:hypothetical protein
VGYERGGVLTEAVRRRPYSIVLLDEVEKAHADVHEMFYQVFDKGWMEDGEGRRIDFRNTIILLTSNVGTDLIMSMCKDPELMPELGPQQHASVSAYIEDTASLTPTARAGAVRRTIDGAGGGQIFSAGFLDANAIAVAVATSNGLFAFHRTTDVDLSLTARTPDGTGSGWGYPQQQNDGKSNLFIVNWAQGNSHQLILPHGVDRIEQMGSDAVIVGTDGKDLHFTSLRLGQWPEIVSRYTRKAASQGELRSHGFFYKGDGNDSGTLGLPISVPGRPGYRHLFEDSASILFLRNDSLTFREVGELDSRPERAVNDKCRASCVDWYGNARPLFLKGRVFALLGYELVEGQIDDGRMRELRRISYAPGQQQVVRANQGE